LPEDAVRPRPPKGRITTWVGGHADAALRRAARLADGILLCSRPDTFRHEVAVIRATLDEAGRDPATFELGQYLTIVPDAGGRDAWDEVGEAVLHADWKYGDMEASARRTGRPIPRRGRLTDEEVADSRAVCLTGSALSIHERIAEYRELASPSPLHVVARNYLPGLSGPHQRELLDRFAAEVAARFAAG
jgi:alkanesulfonate monooxygenase SsuD/methylene tetrahydromethanopterin reductase-like flavin-dependent oxidoreductase (luciferase family)